MNTIIIQQSYDQKKWFTEKMAKDVPSAIQEVKRLKSRYPEEFFRVTRHEVSETVVWE